MLPDSCRNAFRHKELRAKAAKCQEINLYLRSQRNTVRKQPCTHCFLWLTPRRPDWRNHFHIPTLLSALISEEKTFGCCVRSLGARGSQGSLRGSSVIVVCFIIKNKAIKSDSKTVRTESLLSFVNYIKKNCYYHKLVLPVWHMSLPIFLTDFASRHEWCLLCAWFACVWVREVCCLNELISWNKPPRGSARVHDRDDSSSL